MGEFPAAPRRPPYPSAVIPDKTSLSVRDAFTTHWIRHYGWPELDVSDQGPEFVGHEFVNYVATSAALHHFIDSQSPWQQGLSLLSATRDVWRDLLHQRFKKTTAEPNSKTHDFHIQDRYFWVVVTPEGITISFK